MNKSDVSLEAVTHTHTHTHEVFYRPKRERRYAYYLGLSPYGAKEEVGATE